jgi:hypothetical protein
MRDHHRSVDGRHVSSSTLQAQAARSLDLLDLIDRTLFNLRANTDILTAVCRELEPKIGAVECFEGPELLDPEGRVSSLLLKAADAANRQYQHAIKCRQSAREARELVEEDGVADGWTGYIGALADYHNLLETLRDRIAIVDSMKSPMSASFSSVKDLLADLQR